jgi:hypothetical protein
MGWGWEARRGGRMAEDRWQRADDRGQTVKGDRGQGTGDL